MTKYEHSCIVVEEAGMTLVIDPGVYTQTLPPLTNVCAIIVTHVHPDHFDPKKLQAIQSKNPSATIYTVAEVAKELSKLKYEIVQAGTSKQCGDFHVSFFGGEHAIISDKLPVWQNVGILVNETFYTPGDSFVVPENIAVDVLAVPAVAPWSKISETIDFITAIKPKQAFPVHTAILSDIGSSIYLPRLQTAVEEAGGVFKNLKPTESIET